MDVEKPLGEPSSGLGARAPEGPSDEMLRISARLSSAYVLRYLSLIRGLGDGDLIDALIGLAIVQANIGHVDSSPPGVVEGMELSGAVPDDLRRPVSVLALADALGVPYETARRRVTGLVKAGICEQVRGGVIMRRAVDNEAYDAVRHANLANLQRMFRAMRVAGVDLD